MKAFRLLLLCGAALATVACDDEGSVTEIDRPPMAYTRFVAAVPDTSGTDWRFIDQLEYSPPAFNLTYRSFTPYQMTAPGERHLRIFPTSSDIDITSVPIIDEMINLEADTYYTIIHAGYARDGATPEDRLIVLQDDIPAVDDAHVAVRVLNLGTGLSGTPAGAVDVYATATTGAALPSSPAFSNVEFGTASGYVTLDTGALALRALPSGSTTPALANASAPAGVLGNPAANLTTIGGSRMGGSAILAIFMPGSAVGSAAPQTSAFVAQTASADVIGATPTGYIRTSGSFITQGFTVGMQVTASGFTNDANNGTSVITDVTATTLTVTKTPSTVAEVAATGRSLRAPRPAWVYVIDKHPR